MAQSYEVGRRRQEAIRREVGGLVRYAIAPYRQVREPLPDEAAEVTLRKETLLKILGTLSERGTLAPSRKTVVFWGATTGAVAAVMLLVGGEDALSGLQNITIVAALPFLLVMVGLAIALVKDLSSDPLIVRRAYAAAAVEQAVVAGVTEHGDDFTLTFEESAPGAGVGDLVSTTPVDPALERTASATS